MQIEPATTDQIAGLLAGRGITTRKTSSSSASGDAVPEAAQSRPVFRLVKSSNDRISGSVPVWGAPLTPEEAVSQTLSDSVTGQKLDGPTHMALALSGQQDEPAGEKDASFGFLDLVDMINPLQHIPVVGTIYRALTGDEIKPISQIVGGAAFGGVIGAVGGIANAIVSEETGKDIGANLLAFVTGEPSGPQADPDTTLAVTSLSYRQPHYNE